MPWILDLPLWGLYCLTGAILFLGGVIKGVIGIGMPMVTTPLLAYLMPVPAAIALMAGPVGFGNLIQMRQGTGAGGVVARFWPILVTMVAGLVLGTWLLSRTDPDRLPIIFGTILVAFALLLATRPRMEIPAKARPHVEPPVGLAAGLLGGFSSFYGPPIILYLIALRTAKDTFIPTMAIVYAVGVIPLYGSLAVHGILTWPILLVSVAGIVPTVVGMDLGRRIRDRINQRLFERIVLFTLAILGLTLIYQGLAP